MLNIETTTEVAKSTVKYKLKSVSHIQNHAELRNGFWHNFSLDFDILYFACISHRQWILDFSFNVISIFMPWISCVVFMDFDI